MQKQHYQYDGYETVIKTAADGGNSARLYVPKSWQGKKCVVILLDPLGEQID